MLACLKRKPQSSRSTQHFFFFTVTNHGRRDADYTVIIGSRATLLKRCNVKCMEHTSYIIGRKKRGEARMANDNILCAIMRSHNTCDIMRYYVLLCPIMRQLCGVMRSLCAVPPTPPPKKSRSEVVKSAQNRAEFDFGVQMGLWCGFY